MIIREVFVNFIQNVVITDTYFANFSGLMNIHSQYMLIELYTPTTDEIKIVFPWVKSYFMG